MPLRSATARGKEVWVRLAEISYSLDNFKLILPGQEPCTIVFATGASSVKLAAVNTLLFELAMSFS